MTKIKNVTKEDRDLFRQSVGKIKRIKHDNVIFERKKSSPVKKNTSNLIDAKSLNSEEPFTLMVNDELSFKRPGVQTQLFRKLKRGQITVEKELDLHGMTIPSAKISFMQFLKHCIEMRHRCVRIIHGKGKGSENNMPVLKNNINQWLPQMKEVLAYCSAQPSDGGRGAVYVLLKMK